MHSILFASCQFEFAQSQINTSSSSSSSSSSFDILAFAAGYGAHLTEDDVGHYPSVGYLNPNYDHDLEIAVDAFLVKSFNSNTSSSFDIVQFDSESMYFILLSTSAYPQLSNDTNFVPLNQTTIQDSVNAFNTLTTEEILLIDLDRE
jgi:hypothetical protein